MQAELRKEFDQRLEKRFKEMEEQHLAQLAELLIEREQVQTKTNSQVSDLQLKLDLSLKQQSEQHQNDLQTKEASYLSELDSLRDQQNSLQAQLVEKGNTDKKLKQTISELEKQQQTLTSQHNGEKH